MSKLCLNHLQLTVQFVVVLDKQHDFIELCLVKVCIFLGSILYEFVVAVLFDEIDELRAPSY